MNWWEGLFNVVVFQDANNTMLTPKKTPDLQYTMS